MATSLSRRLTLSYISATLVIVLVLAIGVAVSEIVSFTKDVRSTVQTARDEAVAMITTQVRAGHSLRDAAQTASEHLGRPHILLFVVSHTPPITLIFDGARRYRGLTNAVGRLLFTVMYVAGFFGPDAGVTKTTVVPGGTLFVQPDIYRLIDETAATYLRLLPFAIIAIAIAFVLARNIVRHALRPVLDVTHALDEFAQGDFTPVRIPANAAPEVRAVNVAYNAAAAQAQKAVEDRESSADNVRTFIADASHELKTPLTIIMGYIGAISEGVVTDRADEQRILTKTLAECRRMRSTIEKLIALARLDREPLNAAPFDIVELTREVTDSMKALASELSFNASTDGEALVLGNHDELREALICIIENAVKYAPGSPIDVQVTKAADISVVEIADAGPGMSAEDREHVFERFRRGSSHGDVEGSGLGLAIAKRAVERANGRIALSSELGRGTTVRLYLPCDQRAE